MGIMSNVKKRANTLDRFLRGKTTVDPPGNNRTGFVPLSEKIHDDEDEVAVRILSFREREWHVYTSLNITAKEFLEELEADWNIYINWTSRLSLYAIMKPMDEMDPFAVQLLAAKSMTAARMLFCKKIGEASTVGDVGGEKIFRKLLSIDVLHNFITLPMAFQHQFVLLIDPPRVYSDAIYILKLEPTYINQSYICSLERRRSKMHKEDKYKRNFITK
jgi:hypothetical protein